MSTRQIKFYEAIREGIESSLMSDPNVYIIGLGVPDPTGVFGTTKDLREQFGHERVYDMPISENAVTGIILGSSLVGMRPVMTHMRLEFAMLATDQLVNQAAKWHYMFGGQSIVPITIRIIIGRGWGQGPQHSQSLHSWFSHIPGLKVVMPTTPYDAKGLLISSIEDNNPVIFLEHRWLYNMYGPVPEEPYKIPLGEPKIIINGNDLTVVASSYMVLEAIKAAKEVKNQGINVEVIDIRTLNPLDDTLILESVSKTGRLIVCDHATYTGSYAGEVISRVSEKVFDKLKVPPRRITMPDCPTPTTRALSNYYYPSVMLIVSAIKESLGKRSFDPVESIMPDDKLDIPDSTFTGPF